MERVGNKAEGTPNLWISASFTIEASLLLPVLIGMLLLFSQTAVYFHDRNVTVSMQQEATTYARNLSMAGEDDMIGKAQQYVAEKGQEAVFGSSASISVSGGKRQAIAASSIFWKDWLPGWRQYSGRDASQEGQIQDKEWITHPCSLIRKWRLIKEGTGAD